MIIILHINSLDALIFCSGFLELVCAINQPVIMRVMTNINVLNKTTKKKGRGERKKRSLKVEVGGERGGREEEGEEGSEEGTKEGKCLNYYPVYA